VIRARRAPFSIEEARDLVEDLFTPKPAVYWTDFLVSWTVGALAFGTVSGCLRGVDFCARAGERGPALAALAFVVSCLAFYRAVSFLHEIVHLPREAFAGFRRVWNLLCGIPFLLPSFMYATHRVHHSAARYGSREDGEYVPWARRPVVAILGSLAQGLLVPALLVTRFLVLAPLSWASPGIADFAWRRASSLVVTPTFVRAAPTPEELRSWRRLEAGCFGAIVATLVATAAGVLPPACVLQAYVTGVTITTLNAIRTLAAHRYRHGDGGLSHLEQVLDSVNYPRRPVASELWAPVGLRFHALHHLFPSLPYHALPAAHRRLMGGLPADSPYRRTESPGLVSSLRCLWNGARGCVRERGSR
jgi:fatty acid desaturase